MHKFLRWLGSLFITPEILRRQCSFCAQRWEETYMCEYAVEYAENPVDCPYCGMKGVAWKK